ncbi:signal peptide peptidase SppA [Desulforhabdus sp. TSK]|uniref:signal peptide peptidase SppA n=1 Tax=Desulforhabdus sp. TSK TaxID=2925014 RepID=UPI001FC80E07|nr:signal peptide peptidase SppA [Desulforhabdus sp. TSK]GKT10122.1 multidrug transporter [Desulforhabdus sp. TSK]
MRLRSFWFPGLFLLLIILGFFWVAGPELDFLSSPNQIAVVEVRGLIDNSQETVKALRKYCRDDHVKAVLVRIESPGGGIGPSQEIAREVTRTLKEKPVVASLGGIAASGGYYIASAASHIVANPGTITGSIGVIISFPNLKELFDRVGYFTNVIKSGPFKDMGNPGREMTPEERALLQETIDKAYGQFVRDVARGRHLPEEKVRQIADGRLIMGETARELGLVDALGNFQDAVEAATALAKIEGEPELVYHKKQKRTLLDYLLGSEASESLNHFLNGSANFLRYQMPFP